MLSSASITTGVHKRYVDDKFAFLNKVEKGWRWDAERKEMILSVNPEDDRLADDERTALVCRDIANTVTPMLQWTCDYPSAHSNEKMPVLDLVVWYQEEKGVTKLLHEFYMKPVTNLVSIPANSALSKNVKFNSYRQEVYRILRNTSFDLPWTVKVKHINDLSWRMLKSGYNSGFRTRIFQGGIMGYLKTLGKCKQLKVPFYRSKTTIKEAERKKGKGTDWFRGDKGSKDEFRSVLFIPPTPNSEVAQRIRKLEMENTQGRKSRIRVVELSWVTVKDSLSSKYP